MSAVRTPLSQSAALALGNRRYKKQILKLGDISYQQGTFSITPDYLGKVVNAFDAGAIKRVPFQLADASNAHTEDPLRRFGTVLALHQTDEGLDAVIELDDEAARLVDRDPEFGVSVLIKHDRTTGEGDHYDAVLAHVLGTTDPVLTSLAPWQPELAASNDAGDVLDLLALTSAPRDETPTPDGADPDPKEKAAVPITLTDEQAAALQALLPVLTGQAGINKPTAPAAAEAPTVQPADPTPADQPFTGGDPEPNVDDHPADDPADPVHREENPADTENAEAEFTEAELDEMVRALSDDLDEAPAEEPVLVAASNDAGPDALQLSHDLRAERQARERLELRLAQVERERDDRAYAIERDRFARELGIAPRLTDIIAPLLRGSGASIALSNGQQANAGELVRRFVRELHATGFLDLSLSQGSALDLGDDESSKVEAERKSIVDTWLTTHGSR